ncbi:hypothetical protein ILUMI_17884, partial [Ignelater luminosus]
YDRETMTYRFRIEFETLAMFADIGINGHVLNISLVGQGSSRPTFGPVIAVFEIKGEMRKSKGIDYYNAKNVKINLDLTDGTYLFEGLFDNNEVLVRMTNEVFNANSVMVTKVLTPTLEKFAEVGVKKFLKTLTKISYKKLFPLSQ